MEAQEREAALTRANNENSDDHDHDTDDEDKTTCDCSVMARDNKVAPKVKNALKASALVSKM